MVASGDVDEGRERGHDGGYVGVQEPLGVACCSAGLGAGAAIGSGSEHYHATIFGLTQRHLPNSRSLMGHTMHWGYCAWKAELLLGEMEQLPHSSEEEKFEDQVQLDPKLES